MSEFNEILWVPLDGDKDKCCPIDCFLGSKRRFQSTTGQSITVNHDGEGEIGLPPTLINKINLLKGDAPVEGSHVLVIARYDSPTPNPTYVFLNFTAIRGTDKRLMQGGSCASKRPNQSCWISFSLLEKLKLSTRRLAIRGGVPAYKTQYGSVRIGVWNVGCNTHHGFSITRGVPMKIEWKMRSVECYGAPPSYTQKDCYMGVSMQILQHLEAEKDEIILLKAAAASCTASSSSACSPFVAIATTQSIKSTDRRLLSNSCAANNVSLHCWLTAPLREALGIQDNSRERRHVAVFKTLYSPLDIGFLRPVESSGKDTGLLSPSAYSIPQRPSTADEQVTSPKLNLADLLNAADEGVSASASTGPKRKKGSLRPISPRPTRTLFAPSKAAQHLCTSVMSLVSMLTASPQKMAITRYMTRTPPAATSTMVPGMETSHDEATVPLEYIEPYEVRRAPDLPPIPDSPSVFNLSGGWIVQSTSPPGNGPPASTPSKAAATVPPSPFSVSSDMFSPEAAARSSLEALRLTDTGRFYGCCWGTCADIQSDPFTASKVPRSEHSLPRYYVDAAGLVRELIAQVIRTDYPWTTADNDLLAPTRFASITQFFCFFASLSSGGRGANPNEPQSPTSPDDAVSNTEPHTPKPPMWTPVLDPGDLLPGDIVVVQKPKSDGCEFVGHIWVVLDVFLHPASQRCTSCTIVEAIRSTRDARDNKGGIRSRVVASSEWTSLCFVIGRLLD